MVMTLTKATSLALFCCLALMLAACDSQAENEAQPQLTVVIGQYTEELHADFQANALEVGRLSISTDKAVDLSRFPSQRFTISSEGYSSSLHPIVEQDLRGTVYLFTVLDQFPYRPHLRSPNPDISPPSKMENVSADSLTLTVYGLLIERKGMEYPATVTVNFSVDKEESSFELVSAEHMIRHATVDV